ncbi:EAL domain-containing protein, partial [Dolichospermum sp. ST_sed7]|nr:EAL domain-containing protein [Dolichospermum sp. ST_sed7]
MNTNKFSNAEKIILIVDDFPDNLRVLSTALSGQGFQTRCAKNGAMAFMALQTTSPDLILLDINMPEMDGYEVCEHLKSNQLTCKIPVIFLSALDDVFDKTKAFNVGGVDYITKPFQIEEVLIRIQHQLELQAAKTEIEQLNQQLEKKVEERTAELVKVNQALEQKIKERQIIEQRLESIFNSLEDVLVSTSIDNLQLFYINPSAEKIYGYSTNEFFKSPRLLIDTIHPDDRRKIEQAKMAIKTTGYFYDEYRIVNSHQVITWVSDRSRLIYDQTRNLMRVDSIIRDITEQKLAQQQLIHDALHDGLTNLPNRNLFMDRVEQEIKNSKRHPHHLFAVFFIDLDRFKMINDSLGHTIGDKFLQAIAKLLESCLREEDTVARLGGDEFTILITDIQHPNEALILADRLLNKFLEPIVVEGQIIFTSASIGIVIGNKNYENANDLLRDADIAMYRSKELGRSRYTLFDREMYEQNLRLIQINHDLHYALEYQQFELYYQPIILLKENKLAGFEALIRWHHPDWGLVSPHEFIPIAEDAGLIIAIGDWVMQEACNQMCIWQTKFPETTTLKMSINLASQQIQDFNLLEKLDQVLSKTGINGNQLRLEITETMIMNQCEETIVKLEQLRARNIQLSIDDFGQGYSSLSYLHRFPVNTLKIDRTFIDQMSLGGQNLEIIRIIIILAHTLNMDVVAQGVETEIQAHLLKELGCEFP